MNKMKTFYDRTVTMAGGDDVDCRASDVAPDFLDRARFYAIRQVPGEPVYDWYRRVLAAAAPCGFAADWRPSAVADKFVTGLRPGPIADRLLGERANGRPEDLVAVAVEAEKAVDGFGGKDVIAEIREGLKLYRYSDDNLRLSGGSDVRNDSGRNSKLTALGNDREKTIVDREKLTKIDGKSWWKNKMKKNTEPHENTATNNRYSPLTCNSCCDLATNLLESFEEINAPLMRQRLRSTNGNGEHRNDHLTTYHDDSKCYCSWPTSKRDAKYSSTKEPENPSPGQLSSKTECYVCNDVPLVTTRR